MSANITLDIENIKSISVIPTILEVISRTTGMGFAAVARVTDERWVACAVYDDIQFGLQPGGELKLETTICHEIRQSNQGVVIDHVLHDERYAHHHTPALYGFQSYISIPIYRRDKSFFGTLCAIDPRPARLNNPETIAMFKLYADLISFHLNAIEQVKLAEENLKEEKQTAEFRDRFIAMLGHDLRNPLGAISNSAQLMLRMPTDERLKRLATIVKDSSFRMRGLIENMLDFARGRIGGGIVVDIQQNEPIADILNEVIRELQPLWPERDIRLHVDLQETVTCDGKRIAQLFSNLLANALTHGKEATPVDVKAEMAYGVFTLAVTNAGEPISDQARSRLFQPFSRGEIKPGQEGLGLGLYIASEIAKAHGGTIDVHSDEHSTCFTFCLIS